jgi:hypothetical protein
MSTVIRERMLVGDTRYTIDTFPLEPYLAALPERPTTQVTPFGQNGYVATWTIHDGMLYLAALSTEPFARLFADHPGPVAATWFSGMIRGWLGDRRDTGYPSRTFFNDEIVLEIVEGKVVREWVLDLRSVPDQTDEELRLALPEFLWPARLREGLQ